MADLRPRQCLLLSLLCLCGTVHAADSVTGTPQDVDNFKPAIVTGAPAAPGVVAPVIGTGGSAPPVLAPPGIGVGGSVPGMLAPPIGIQEKEESKNSDMSWLGKMLGAFGGGGGSATNRSANPGGSGNDENEGGSAATREGYDGYDDSTTGSAYDPVSASNEFVGPDVPIESSSFKEISSGWNRSRGLVQLKTKGKNIGPCGSFHYNPDSRGGALTDNYASEITACSMMSLMQDWKKTVCPDSGRGCRIAWGDISDKTHPKFNGHGSHTNGYCVDLRPMRSGEFKNEPLTHTGAGYDRDMTRKLINMIKAKGGGPILFNDSEIKNAKYWEGHSNHIHACFKPNATTRQACKEFTYDEEVCGPPL